VINLSKYELLGKRRLDQLDGLRGACAVAVLVHHMIQTSQVGLLESFIPLTLLKLTTDFGRLAVYIFFVLSGFVIGYTTPEKYTVSEAKKYILRRLIRLYPVYLFAIF
jgi:peptidoglycan/LPS O-acetylase OafA/YrhL